MKKITIASFLLAFAFVATSVNAQTAFPNSGAKKWSAGIQVGPSFLHSDNNETTPMTIGFGVHAKYSISHTFGLRFMMDMGSLEGERTINATEGNMTLTNDYMAFMLQPVFTWGNISHLKTRKTQLYGYTGFGMMMASTSVAYPAGYTPAVATPDIDSNYFMLPVGFGIKYNMSPALDLGLDYSYNFIFSDLGDGINPQSFANRNSDMYSAVRVSVSYKFGGKAGGDNGDAHRDWINPLEGIYSKVNEHDKKINDLSQDDDGDGVSNMFDKEPETAEGAIVDGAGRELDADGDGIPNSKDEEPNTPFGAETDENGKGIDSDGDGVYDGIDVENNTSSDMLVNHEGIGIMKKELAGKLGASAGILPTIFFETNSTVVAYTDYPALQQVAEYMKKNSGLKLKIIGHADYTGSDSYNEKLGMQRAEAVKEILVGFGAPAANLMVETKGEKDPITDKKSAQARKANRRVQFMITE